MKAYWEVEISLHSFFDFGTTWRWVVSFTHRTLYLQGKSSSYPLGRRLGGPQSHFGCGGEEKNSQPLPGLKLPIIQSVAQPYTDWAITAPAQFIDTLIISLHTKFHMCSTTPDEQNAKWSFLALALSFHVVKKTCLKSQFCRLFLAYSIMESILSSAIVAPTSKVRVYFTCSYYQLQETEMSAVGVASKWHNIHIEFLENRSVGSDVDMTHTHTHTHTHTAYKV
jgi:hypothetical protein